MNFARKLFITATISMATFAFSVYAKEAEANEVAEGASNRICTCVESGDYANCKSLTPSDTSSDRKAASEGDHRATTGERK